MVGDFSIFALVESAGSVVVRRISLSSELQTEITSLFQAEAASFYTKQLNPVAFDGAYRVDGDDIFEVEGFPLPTHVGEVVENPHAVEPLSSHEIETFSVKGVFATRVVGDTKEVLFQILDRSAVISKERSILWSKERFIKLNDTGLTLGRNLCATWRHGTLRFFSYNNARKVLTLTTLFREATNEDIVSVLKKDIFAECDQSAVIEGVNQWMRHRFTLILGSGVLDGGDPRKIQRIAKRYGVKVGVADNRLQFPMDHSEATELLRFLSEEYYDGVISGTRFRANSKLIVSKAALP